MADDEKKKAENKQKANEYNKKIKNNQGKIDEHRKEINALNEKIRRLKAAKNDILDEHYKIYSDIIKNDRYILEDSYKWKGSWYSINFKRDQKRLVSQDEAYRTQVGKIIEAINNRIIDMEVLKKNHEGIIGNLISDIKILGKMIENLNY